MKISHYATILLGFSFISSHSFGQNYGPPPVVANLQTLIDRSPPSSINPYVMVAGYYTNGDWGDARKAVWVKGGVATTNSGCVFDATGGQWHFPDCDGGELKPEWFGGKAGFLTNATDAASLVGVSSSSAVQAATDYLSAAGGGVVKFGPGTYWFDEPVQVKPRVKYKGASPPTGFLARRDIGLGETARIGGLTYIEGYTSAGLGFPLFVLSGNVNYTNMFSESFVNKDGDTTYYRSGANSFDDLILTVYQWGWGSTNNLPVAGIVVDQVDGVKVRNCGFWNIAGTGIWAHGARGMIVDSCWFMNCLIESVQVMYTSDTRIFNCGMGVGGVVYYRANTHVVQGSEIWNPDQSLVNYAGGSASTNITEFGTTRTYAIERTIVSDSTNDWFQGTTPIGADTGTLVYFTGTSVPAPFATNTPYFAIAVPSVTNAVRLATSPLNALAGTYVSVTDSSTNGTWHLTGTDSCVYGYDSEELLIQGNRMDQSFRHVVELHQMNRSTVSGNWMWEVGANMGPARRNLYMGNDTIFSGVLVDGSGNIQINDNLITGGYAFSSRLDHYKVPHYGVWSVGSGDVSVLGNRFKWLNAGVYSDSASSNVRESGNSYDPSVARPADSASTSGNNARRWDGIWLKGTNVVLSDAIPAAFTNLQDFTIVIDTEQGLPFYVGSTNQAYSPLFVLGTSTNYASTDAWTENSLSLSQYYLSSFSSNYVLLNNIQGATTNYRRSTLTYLSELSAKDKPMELIIGRTNYTWYIYANGYFAQFTNANVSGAAPPASDVPIHASRLLLGYWPVTYRSGWIGSVQLYNRSFGYNDFLYERFRGYATNLVLNWDFKEDSGNTVIDKSGNGINGTVISLDGTTLHEFGPRDTKTVLEAPTNGLSYVRSNATWRVGVAEAPTGGPWVRSNSLWVAQDLFYVNGALIRDANIFDSTQIQWGVTMGNQVYAALANTAVTPGTYTLATVTVDQKGRITSASSGSASSGDELTVNGSATTNPNLKDGSNITFGLSSSDITADLTASGVSAGTYTAAGGTFVVDAKGRITAATNGLSPFQIVSGYITNGANVTIDSSSGTYISIAASSGGGSTNGTPLSVDGTGPLAEANLADSTEINPAASGANITFSIVTSSIATNKIDSTFYGLLTAADAVGAGTNIFVNASLVSQANLLSDTGSGGVRFAVSGSDISAWVTNMQTSLAFTNGVTNAAGTVQLSVAAGANISLATNSGQITIGAIIPTNSGTVVSVDGSIYTLLDFGDTVDINFTASGLNASATVVNNSITTNKLASSTRSFLLSRVNHTDTQPWSTLDTLPTIISRLVGVGDGASGDILYRDATGWTNLVKSSNGKVLKLMSGLPSWEDDNTSAGGYISKSVTVSMASNTVDNTTLYSWTIPGDTLLSDGDELEIYVPATLIGYTGATTGYSYEFLLDGTSPCSAASCIDGSFADVVPITSSAFALDWTVRIKRMSPTNAFITMKNVLGADGSGDIENLVTATRFLDYSMVSGWAVDFPIELKVTLEEAHPNHAIVARGYTVRKLQ